MSDPNGDVEPNLIFIFNSIFILNRILILTLTVGSMLIGLCLGAFLVQQKKNTPEQVPGIRVVTHQLECFSTSTYIAGNKATDFSPTLVGAIYTEDENNPAALGMLWFSPKKNSWAFSISTKTDETCEVVIGNSLQRFPTEDVPEWINDVLRPVPHPEPLSKLLHAI